ALGFHPEIEDMMENIEDYLKEYSNEVSGLTRTYFSWKYINVIASSDENVRKSLNENPTAWTTILHSLQTTMFITLGRIFDIDDEAFSIHKFVKYCAENVDQFSRLSLKQRKMEGEETPKWLEGYLNTAHYPKREELLRLRGEVSKQCKIYDQSYKPIRHRFMAHKEFAAIGTAASLFAETNIKELEGIISFCNQIKFVIQEQYYNGKKIQLPAKVLYSGDDSIAEREVKQLLMKLSAQA
ncbi:hypothetical protein ACEV9O_23210, partial [Vibrio parahaemolyticus]